MRRRNRDINIFNMSALDLFASALGAFILIAVVLFPYFPNTGNSPEQIAVLRQKLQQTQEALQVTQAELEKIKIPDLDVVIAIDVTGSMEDEIIGLKNQINELTALLKRLAPSVGIGVVTFGDRDFQSPTVVQAIVEVKHSAANFKQIQRFVNGIEVNMGVGSGDNTDTGEAIDLALRRAVTMAWRTAAARKYIVIITDDLVHPNKMQSTFRLAQDFAATQGNSVSVVQGSLHPDIPPEVQKIITDYLQKLAQHGNGTFVPAGGSIIGAILLAILD